MYNSVFCGRALWYSHKYLLFMGLLLGLFCHGAKEVTVCWCLNPGLPRIKNIHVNLLRHLTGSGN